jgi:hypothetical protein
MINLNEARSTNEYLIGELVTARKQIEVLTEHIETLRQDLKDSSQLLNACVAYMS